MAKWVRSTTMKSWNVRGKVIPASTSPDWLELSETEYGELKKSPVFKAYEKSGEIIISTSEPSSTPVNIQNQVGKLREKNRKLEEELAELKKSNSFLKAANKGASNAETEKELASAKEELASAKEELASAKEELETAKRQIAGLKGQVTKLSKNKEEGETSE